MRLQLTLVSALAVLALTAPSQADEIETTAFIQGKIINSEGHPVQNVKVIVHNDDDQSELTDKSDAEGNFEIKHPHCSTLSFYVIPPEKTNLAIAQYSKVAGDMTKHFIVQLHRGFKVTGRIMAEGQGLKNLEIRVKGGENEGRSAAIHGGGFTRTKNNGDFILFLTPGKKVLQIVNDVYSNLSPVYQHEFTITGDTHLPSMTLPLIPEKDEQKKR